MSCPDYGLCMGYFDRNKYAMCNACRIDVKNDLQKAIDENRFFQYYFVHNNHDYSKYERKQPMFRKFLNRLFGIYPWTIEEAYIKNLDTENFNPSFMQLHTEIEMHNRKFIPDYRVGGFPSTLVPNLSRTIII